MHLALKRNAIGFTIAFQIVTTDIERKARRHAEHPLQRLRLHLDGLKLTLRFRIAPVRAIPVAKIHEFASFSPGNTPV
ncbi:hypothetical protein D3C71_1975140 [compost metagenome]